MIRKEFGIWINTIGGEVEWFPLMDLKARPHGFLREKGFKTRGEQQGEFIIEADQPLVEGGVVEAVEADAVADVEALAFVAAPRQDVGGDEKLADGQAGDGAAVGVVVEDDLAEIVLPAALFGGAGDFGFAAWRAFDPADAGAGDDFGGFVFGFGEQRVEALLTERNEIGGVFVELLPHGAVEVARSGQTDDSAQLQSRIQRGEVV